MRRFYPVLGILVAVAVAVMMVSAATAGSSCGSKTKATTASATKTNAGCAATCGAKSTTASTCTAQEKAACASKMTMAGTTGNGSHLVLGVAYMTCNGCASQVTKALQGVDGVRSVAVDYRTGTADVEFDSEMISSVELVNAVEKIGYHAQVGPYSDDELAKFAKGETADVKVTTATAGKTCDPKSCVGKKGH
jgi:copper chaperone CopZ